jgi:hypothetical protein
VSPYPVTPVSIVAVFFPTLNTKHLVSVFGNQQGIDYAQIGPVVVK